MRSRRLFKIREEILRELRKLKEELDARIFVFGSYARGDHTLESDVDILVISERFKEMSYPERVEIIRLRLPLDIGFDIIALTPEEFEKKKDRASTRAYPRNGSR